MLQYTVGSTVEKRWKPVGVAPTTVGNAKSTPKARRTLQNLKYTVGSTVGTVSSAQLYPGPRRTAYDAPDALRFPLRRHRWLRLGFRARGAASGAASRDRFALSRRTLEALVGQNGERCPIHNWR